MITIRMARWYRARQVSPPGPVVGGVDNRQQPFPVGGTVLRDRVPDPSSAGNSADGCGPWGYHRAMARVQIMVQLTTELVGVLDPLAEAGARRVIASEPW